MDTTDQPAGAQRPNSLSEELKNAADEIRLAADSAVERMVGGQLRSHLRSAAKHVLSAGVAAIEESERRRRERHARAHARTQTAAEAAPASAAGVDPMSAGNNHVPECL